MACAQAGGRENFDADAGPSADGGVEAAAGEGGSFASEASAPLTGRCKRDVTVGELTISNSQCFTNQQIEGKTAELVFPCEGGLGTITFGAQTFEGSVKDDEIKLLNVEKFTFEGCPWQSMQRLEGNFADKQLRYQYTEAPLQVCKDQFACEASGTFVVSGGAIQPK